MSNSIDKSNVAINTIDTKVSNIINVPDELKEDTSWVLVRPSIDSSNPKIPWQTNGYKASSTNPKTWDTFDNCYTKFIQDDTVEGIGYMLSLEDHYIFVDIDKTDRNESEKNQFMNKYNTYLEHSQSGSGYHMIFKIDDKSRFLKYAKDIKLIGYPDNMKKTLSSKHGDYEIYIERRYFWLTGDIVNERCEIEEIGYSELVEIFEFIESKKTSKTNINVKSENKKSKEINSTNVLKSPKLTNEQILELCKKAKNKDKFEKLWNEEGKTGNSESDQVLMNLLAFYTQDIEQLCELMRESKRDRDKFDRNDYLERTANKAIGLLKVTYDPTFKSDSFITKVIEQGAVITDDMKELPWILKEENKKTGKTKVTVLCPILADYLSKNGNYIFVREGAKKSINRFLYRKGCYKLIVDDEFRGYIKKYIPLELQTMKYINEVMNLIYTNDGFISNDEINPENYINFTNGLFNVDTWKMEKHTPDVYTTIQIPCDYNPDMKPLTNSIFDKYINTLTENDKDIERLLKQFMSVTISNIHGYRLKKSLFMVGKGDSGKSQIKILLRYLLGKENTSAIDLSDLEQRFGTSSVYNKRLVGSNDMGFMTIKELKTFKKMTGGDDIDFEFKNEGKFSDRYYGVIWNCCNEMPKFGGDKGDWTYDRMVIVKCNNVISKEKQDSKITDKMYLEREYIIWQLMNNLKEVINNGYRYDIPETCNLELNEYKVSNDSVLAFLKDCTTKVEIINGKPEIDKDVTNTKMYVVYKNWCEDNNNNFKETKKKFTIILENKKLSEIKKTNGNRYYTKFKLNEECKDTYLHKTIF